MAAGYRAGTVRFTDAELDAMLVEPT